MIALPAWFTWTAIKAFLAGIPRQVWIGLTVLALVFGAYRWAYNAGANAVQADWDAERAANKLAADAQAAEAAAKEAKDAAAFALLADNLRKENERAKQDADRTIADLRRGTIRLRSRFTCPSTVSQAAGSASGSDETRESGLRSEDAEFLISESARADGVARTLQACQAILAAERQ
jgi:hypothetical protein